MKRGNRDAMIDPFCWVVLDQIWPEIFGGFNKALRRVTAFSDKGH
jgi:hypothetical protein